MAVLRSKRQMRAVSTPPPSAKRRKTAPKSRPTQAKKHFRLLDLPPEIRNSIYEMVLEDYPIAHLSRTKKALATKCGLIRVSKQVHDEFLGVVTVYAPIIQTSVSLFNFGHVIAFFNRMSDSDFSKLEEKPEADSAPAQRTTMIQFDFKGPSGKEERNKADMQELQRWFNRLERPEKRGFKVSFQYTSVPADPKVYLPYGSSMLNTLLEAGRDGSRWQEEAGKINSALKRGHQRAVGRLDVSWRSPRGGFPVMGKLWPW